MVYLYQISDLVFITLISEISFGLSVLLLSSYRDFPWAYLLTETKRKYTAIVLNVLNIIAIHYINIQSITNKILLFEGKKIVIVKNKTTRI